MVMPDDNRPVAGLISGLLMPGILASAWVLEHVPFLLRVRLGYKLWILAIPFSWCFYFAIFALIAFVRERNLRAIQRRAV